MHYYNAIKYLLIILFLLYSSAVFSSDKLTVDSAADSLVSLLVDTDAVEHRKARQIHYIKDMKGTAIVFFTIEGFNGGNNYTFYLAVFEPEWKFNPVKGEAQQRNAENIAKYRLVGYLPVGGKGWRSVDFKKFTVENKQITLQTKEYADTDPMCCPSIARTATYKIDDKQLIEVRHK